MSPALQATLMRARDYASGQSHNQVTVEHLLLALSEDDDAALVLQSSRVDIGRLRHDVADYLGNLADRSPGPTQPVVSPQLAEILKYATLAAKQGRRAKIDGAIVLAALVGDGRSMAASFLNAQGLTFEEAIRVLQRAAAPSPTAASATVRSEPLQPTVASRNGANAEDILAAARDRVERRTPAPRPEPVVVPRPETRSEARAVSPREANIEAREGPHAEQNSAPGPDQRLEPVVQPAAGAKSAPAGPPALPRALPSADSDQQPMQARAETPVLSPAVATEEPPAFPAAMDASGNPQPVRILQSQGANGAVAAAIAEAPQLAPLDHAARAPTPTWAPPPLPVPTQQPAQARMPPPGQAAGRAPMPPVPGPPDWPHRAESRPENRPDMTPVPPWSDPAPRPSSMPHHGQQLGQQLGQLLGQQPGAGGPAFGQYPQNQPQSRHTPSGPFPSGQAAGGPPIDAPRAPAIEPAQISHTIPKRMRVGSKTVVEVRVARAAIAGGGAGPRPVALRAELTAFRAISVRLRGTKSAYAIEAGSPETQWDQAIGPTGRLAGEVAVWRFQISPLKAARADLQIIASARTVGADGVIADTVLPDQVVAVRVGRDIGRTMRRFAGVSTIAIVSIVAVKLTEEFLGFDLMRLIRALIGF